jgi:predicted peptidase
MIARLLAACGILCFATLATAAEPKAERPGGVGEEYEIRTFKSEQGRELPYGWLTPQNVKAGEKYPLVLCLHGKGGNTVAADFLAQPKLREKYPCFVIAPGSGKDKWANMPALGRTATAEALTPAIELVRSVMKSQPIDPERVYVTGQSMGGVGSWAAAAKYPDLFAAAVPICGAWDVVDAPKMVPVPVWAFHGELDETVPVKFSRELTAALTKAGGAAKYTEFAGVGHGSWFQSYAQPELWDWLFAQRKTTAKSDAK